MHDSTRPYRGRFAPSPTGPLHFGSLVAAVGSRQILLQRLLGHPTPQYMRLPVAVNDYGEKLSKQTGAAPLTVPEALVRLCQALRFLGQEPPAELATGRIVEIWTCSLTNWRTERIPTRRSIREGEAA